MATETADGEADDAGAGGFDPDHWRSVTVTAAASLAGIAAGIGSGVAASGPNDTLGVGLFAAATVAAFGVVRAAGIDVGEFSAKDYLYVAFMSFSMWFVTWGVLLTTT